MDSLCQLPSDHLVRKLIHLCHNEAAPLHSRILAPLLRKFVTTKLKTRTIDLSLNSINYRCHFADNYSERKFIFTPWRYDLEERKLLSHLLKKGGNFIDIGANVGLYTLTAARAMKGQQGKIIAIEPNPPTLNRLNDNLALNLSLTENRVTVISMGVAEQRGFFELYVNTSNLGASGISNHTHLNTNTLPENSISIQCLPLIDILDQEEIETITALKIDIEGAEDKALLPFFDRCTESRLPEAIFIENSEHLWSTDLFDKIRQQGYSRIMQSRMNSVFIKNRLPKLSNGQT